VKKLLIVLLILLSINIIYANNMILLLLNSKNTGNSSSKCIGIKNLDNIISKYNYDNIEEEHTKSNLFSKRIYYISLHDSVETRLLTEELSNCSEIKAVYCSCNPIMGSQPNDDNLDVLIYVNTDSMVTMKGHRKQLDLIGLNIGLNNSYWDVFELNSQFYDNVICGLWDSYMINWLHEDLNGNMWVNQGEDINLNGIADSSDLDGIDNDSDGIIDNITGALRLKIYNYVNNTFNDHATKVAGVAFMETNNDNGIYGPFWNNNLKMFQGKYNLSITHLYDNAPESYGYISSTGSHWSLVNNVNCDIIKEYVDTFGVDSGKLIFKCAFNINSYVTDTYYNISDEDSFVIITAALSNNFKKHWSCNFGPAISICAPSNNVMTTHPSGNNIYCISGASSIATPLVGAVAGMIKLKWPEYNFWQIRDRLLGTVKNIDIVNPYYAGMLGTGCVNAYNALTMARQPRVFLSNWLVNSSNKKELESGRINNLEFIFKNVWKSSLWSSITIKQIYANDIEVNPNSFSIPGISQYESIQYDSIIHFNIPQSYNSGDIVYFEFKIKSYIGTIKPFTRFDTVRFEIITSQAENYPIDLGYQINNNSSLCYKYSSINNEPELLLINSNNELINNNNLIGNIHPISIGNIITYGDFNLDNYIDYYTYSGNQYSDIFIYKNGRIHSYTKVEKNLGFNPTSIIIMDYDLDFYKDIVHVSNDGSLLIYNGGSSKWDSVNLDFCNPNAAVKYNEDEIILGNRIYNIFENSYSRIQCNIYFPTPYKEPKIIKRGGGNQYLTFITNDTLFYEINLTKPFGNKIYRIPSADNYKFSPINDSGNIAVIQRYTSVGGQPYTRYLFISDTVHHRYVDQYRDYGFCKWQPGHLITGKYLGLDCFTSTQNRHINNFRGATNLAYVGAQYYIGDTLDRPSFVFDINNDNKLEICYLPLLPVKRWIILTFCTLSGPTIFLKLAFWLALLITQSFFLFFSNIFKRPW